MTQDIDKNMMRSEKETKPDFRDELPTRMKDVFIWVLGEAAVTETTKTVRHKDPNKMDIIQLNSLFRQNFNPKKKNFTAGLDSLE